MWGVEGQGLRLGQSFVHQNRIRQAASSLGAAVYCIEESVKYARAAQAVRQAAVATTRRSSGRWSSCTPSAKCCAS